MAGELEKASVLTGIPVEGLIEGEVRKQANAQAMAEPVPGAVRDALLQRTPIKVGDYFVRACCDGDIEYLSLLEHPMNELRLQVANITVEDPEARKAAFEAIWEKIIASHRSRGPMGWQLAFLFTHTPDENDAVFDKGGLEALRKAAKKEFSRVESVIVRQVADACIAQYLRSWQPMLSYDAAATESDDGEVVVKKNSLAEPISATASV